MKTTVILAFLCSIIIFPIFICLLIDASFDWKNSVIRKWDLIMMNDIDIS